MPVHPMLMYTIVRGHKILDSILKLYAVIILKIFDILIVLQRTCPVGTVAGQLTYLLIKSIRMGLIVKTPTQLQRNLNPTVVGGWTRK